MQDMQYYYVVVAITISRKLRRACDYDAKTNPRQDLCRVAIPRIFAFRPGTSQKHVSRALLLLPVLT